MTRAELRRLLDNTGTGTRQSAARMGQIVLQIWDRCTIGITDAARSDKRTSGAKVFRFVLFSNVSYNLQDI